MYYVGSELELFSEAVNWKRYLIDCISPHIRGRVLEVGAGIGGNTVLMKKEVERSDSWVCLEPDETQVKIMATQKAPGTLPLKCEITTGTIREIDRQRTFDTIIYIDVLEHIEDDAAEIAYASQLLDSEGKLIILAPAHQFLFNEFDEAVGHFRRYKKTGLKEVKTHELTVKDLRYLDSCGLLLSLANKLFFAPKYAHKKNKSPFGISWSSRCRVS